MMLNSLGLKFHLMKLKFGFIRLNVAQSSVGVFWFLLFPPPLIPPPNILGFFFKNAVTV